MEKSNKLTGIDLCSGIGGITLGLSEYVNPVAYCEIDEYASQVLKARIADGFLPDAPIHEDVKKFPYKSYKNKVDIIYAGFPCQDISVAGKREGLEGKRSSLFFKIIALAKKIESPFIFLENVPGIRTKGLEEVARTITRSGYDCRWLVLPASALGAPHVRERWFLLAYSPSFAERRIFKSGRRKKTNSRCDGNKKPLANPTSIGQQKTKRGRLQEKKSMFEGQSWWAAQPAVCRVAHGLPHRVDRLRALGNGVVPIQVKVAFEQLLGIHDERYFDTGK